jgi:hypothetical protein
VHGPPRVVHVLHAAAARPRLAEHATPPHCAHDCYGPVGILHRTEGGARTQWQRGRRPPAPAARPAGGRCAGRAAAAGPRPA